MARNEVRAEAFVLVDATGNPQASFFASPNGPMLAFMGDGSRGKLSLSLLDGKPAIILSDESGASIEVVMRDVGASPSIEIRDTTRNVRAAVSLFEDGPHITLLDHDGPGYASLEMRDGNAQFILRDRSPAAKLVIAVREDGPHLTMWNTAEKVVLDAPKRTA